MILVLLFCLGGCVGLALHRVLKSFVWRIEAREPRMGWPRLFLPLISAVVTPLSVHHLGFGIEAILTLYAFFSLLVLALIDMETLTLPDVLTLPLLGVGLLWSVSSGRRSLGEAILGAVLGFVVLWAVDALYERIAQRSGMGRGDFKLMAAMGAWCGASALPSLILVSSLAGVSIALIGIALGRLQRSSAIAFGPCIALSGIVVYLSAG